MSDELLPYFLAEGRELVERAADALIDLERGEGGPQTVEQAFRALHTLKGSAALFDMAELTALLHAAESRLEQARGAEGPLGAQIFADLQACVAETERWLDALAEDGAVPAARRAAAAALTSRLDLDAEAPAPRPAPAATPDWARDLPRGVEGARTAFRIAPDAQAYFRGEDPLAWLRQVPDLIRLEIERRPRPSDPPFACDLVLSALSGAGPEEVGAALRPAGAQAEIFALAAPAAPAPPRLRTLRVDAARLDAASALLDQLSVAINRFAHEASAAPEARFALDQSLTALRSAMARLRLAPLRQLLAPLPRQVREMAAALGKQAELTMAGEHIALDKSILDGLYEPLIHLLRNAVDHGLEPPGVRAAAGKPERGRIRLTATARGDVAIIEIADDGAGLDFARIREVAVRNGLASAEEARGLSDRQTAELIFRPGFSTARAVTDLSGRGVGLDAVRSGLAAIGGRVEMESEPGRGAVARITAPLYTLLARVAVLAVGGERFATPLEAVHEIVRVAASQVTAVRAGEAFVLRGEPLPLARLAPLLGLSAPAVDSLTVLVISTPEGRLGVAVDRVVATMQAPVQTASSLLAAIPGVTGSILEGDGGILLVLDLAALTS